MKQLEVQIMGQSYRLGCPEGGEQRLLEAVEKVDTAMCRIRDTGKVKARDRIAVLAALNLAFESGKSAAAVPVTDDGTIPTGSGERVEHARLERLMAQIDKALGDDGRLL